MAALGRAVILFCLRMCSSSFYFLFFVFVWFEEPRLNVYVYHFYLNEISNFAFKFCTALSSLFVVVVLFVVY